MPRARAKSSSSRRNSDTELSYDAKMVIVVLLLLLFYPVGVVFMWIWMKWPVWVKLLIMLPVLLFFVFVVGIFLVFARIVATGNPSAYYRTRYYQQMPMMRYVSPVPTANPTVTY